ncbi:hypothetical protein [Aliiglaciecola aliphaticivorans]
MKQLIIIFLTFITYGCVNTAPTASEEAYLQAHDLWKAQNERLYPEFSEHLNSYTSQIEELYSNAQKCAKNNVELVFTIDEHGNALQAWSTKDPKTTQCLLDFAKQIEFYAPPEAPLYLAVKMEIDSYQNPFPHVFGQYN